MNTARWTDGKTIIKGGWSYYWPSDTFFIVLDSTDEITGMQRRIEVKGDSPEWGSWKLIREG